jgi:hypothetical protein
MTSTSVRRWLVSQAIGLAMGVFPREREEWAQAMRREVDEIPSDREALWWALGCLQTSCYERLKSLKLTSRLPVRFVRWGMALWVALLAVEMFAFGSIILDYKLGLGLFGLARYPRNLMLDVTPLWEPILALGMGVAFLSATVLVLKRSRVAFWATVAPFAFVPLLFTGRLRLPDSGMPQSLTPVNQKLQFEVILLIAALAITIRICRALWQDRGTAAPP